MSTILLISSCEQSANITKDKIRNAEILLDLTFTDAERDSMIEELEERRLNYRNLRNVELDNAIPPALAFNPISMHKKFDQDQRPITFSDYGKTALPHHAQDLAFFSVGQLAYLIKDKKISSLQLTNFFIERLKEYGPEIECLITLTEELAIEHAMRADREIRDGQYRGPLHGIPYGIKDLFSTKTYKTTWGAMPYKDQIIDKDAAVVKKLETAGAVLVAKLSMGALAWGDVWFGGKTRNPWDPDKGSSGSSAGSAAAVSAGLVPFAIGTETWGSIVSPSTVCGVTGLRPTYGRVSRDGAMALSWSMDKIGPICRNAEDCAMVFDAIRGPDGIDQSVYDLPFNYSPVISLTDLKIGYLKADFSRDYDFRETDSLALETLRGLGAQLIPIELPGLNTNDLSFILSAEAAAAFDALTRSGKDDLLVRQIKNAWPNVFRAARLIPAVEYINANRLRYQLIQEMEEMMRQVDLYVAPSWEGNNLLLTNLTGHPCVVVPNGFSDHGTPTSFCLVGDLFDEGTIIAVAKEFQSATEFHLKHPSLFETDKKKNPLQRKSN
jgi:Asp-tRNA(Asn)/Glu-tRNA(Gln) amidotransferase A subunit family amidase